MRLGYTAIYSRFWIGQTGRAIVAAGPDAIVATMYLMTCPHGNGIGIFHLSPTTAAEDTGLTPARWEHAMVQLEGVGFVVCDRPTRMVWVVNAAIYQYCPDGALKPTDKRIKGIVNALAQLPPTRLKGLFVDRHGGRLSLPLVDRALHFSGMDDLLGKFSDTGLSTELSTGLSTDLCTPHVDKSQSPWIKGASKGLARGFEAPPKPTQYNSEKREACAHEARPPGQQKTDESDRPRLDLDERSTALTVRALLGLMIQHGIPEAQVLHHLARVEALAALGVTPPMLASAVTRMRNAGRPSAGEIIGVLERATSVTGGLQ